MDKQNRKSSDHLLFRGGIDMLRQKIDDQRKRVTTVIFVLAVLVMGTCGRVADVQLSTLDRINAEGVLRVGYIVFPPTVFQDPTTNELTGHHVETIREIARLAEWRLEFVGAEFGTFVAGLGSGRFDISIAPTFVTVPRATSVAFTRPLFFAGNSAIVRLEDERFASLEDIDQPSVTVAVTQGEAGHEFARANFTNAEVVVHSGSTQSLTFQDVISGRADVALGDAYVTAAFAAEHPDSVKDLFGDAPYNLTPVSWAVRQRDVELLNFLNASLDALDYQGRLKELEAEAGANWLHLRRTWESF